MLAARLFAHRAAPLAPTNDRIAFVGDASPMLERVLRRLRPDTRVLAAEGDRLGGFDLGLEEGRESFVLALGLRGGVDRVRAVLAWARTARTRVADLAIVWTTTDAAPSRLVVTAGFDDVLSLGLALPEAGRQIEDLFLVDEGIVIDERALRAAFPNLRTVWLGSELRASHLRLWEIATRGRRTGIAPAWVRAQGVTCWNVDQTAG